MKPELAVLMDNEELVLTSTFRSHPALSSDLTDEVLHQLLLERRHISLEFTRVYDVLLEVVDNARAKNVIREIIREEYPSLGVNVGRSHREDLVIDMIATGLRRGEIVTHRPTKATLQTILETNELVYRILEDPKRGLLSTAFIRMWGEVLTALEYEKLWLIGLSKFFQESSDSVFYWYHFQHDRARRGFKYDYSKSVRGPLTHSDQLTRCIGQMVTSSSDAEAVITINRAAYVLKTNFYDQFKDPA